MGVFIYDSVKGLTKVAGNATMTTATASAVGAVKPDNTTITIDEDGTIHGWDRAWKQITVANNNG